MNNFFLNILKCLSLLILYFISCKFLIYDPHLIAFIITLIFFYFTFQLLWEKNHYIISIISTIIILSLALVIYLTTTKATLINLFLAKNEIYSRQIPFFNEFEIQNQSNLNIFFTETNYLRTNLTLKQMCSIESAAYNNPESIVYIYSFNATINEDLLSIYKNIKYVRTKPEEVFKDTLLYNWWIEKEKLIKKSEFSIHHISDSIRIALLYKYGGYYSDLDTITLKSLKSLADKNGVGLLTELSHPSIGNGILIFEKEHKLIEEAMKDLIKNYNAKEWGFNGPLLFIRTIKKYCKLDDIFTKLLINFKNENRNDSFQCDVKIFPENYFYPINWENAIKLFRKNATFDINMFLNTYSVHFYGKFSENFQVKLNDFSIYEYFASQNCPYVYNLLKFNSNIYF